ncbi:IclR family transcriptional regulator [Actinomadura hibisca]|uniref:IclR family transcriptional regulator n=1 Tax=Actinomadura hibisca TaxID=68565 RepID=UPI00082EF0C8|nr:IclR family transcriptional regulator [Actinomadura hibisca]
MTGHKSSGRGYRERNSTADRALEILLLFDDDRTVATGTDIADHLGVARSTAYRYLQSLVASGFIEEQPPAGYRLGPRVFELARLARKGLGLSEIARPLMRELAAEVGETVLLTRRTGGTVVCLEREEADHPVRLSYERGHVLPINAGAAALVLLAYAPPQEIAAALGRERLPRFTGATVTDAAELYERLESIKADGLAVSRGELDPDVLGVAAPIRGARGEVVAAVSVAALSHRVPVSRVPTVSAAVRRTAATIGDRLRLIDS